MASLRVACVRVRDGAQLPTRATAAASGFDLHACLTEPTTLAPGRWLLIPTGVVMAIPEGYEGTVRPRSGLALRHGLGLLNSPGTIDSDYRGEVQVLLMNWGSQDVTIHPGDRIAQIVFQSLPETDLFWADAVPETDRGGGGFGHTGVAPLNQESK
jgi:dUTP pyrophosphatase